MRQNAEGATALSSLRRQPDADESYALASGLPVIFQEALVLQLVEKLQAEGLRRSGRIPKEVAILLVGATLCPGRTNRPAGRLHSRQGLAPRTHSQRLCWVTVYLHPYSKTQCPIFSVNRHAYRG
jgi:hypothetical protein